MGSTLVDGGSCNLTREVIALQDLGTAPIGQVEAGIPAKKGKNRASVARRLGTSLETAKYCSNIRCNHPPASRRIGEIKVVQLGPKAKPVFGTI